MNREEAYNRIDAIIAKHEIDDEYVTITSALDYDALRFARKLLEQEPKIGHWEWVQYDYIGNWHCSECRSIVIECVDKNDKCGIPLYKYCPQCGAKMQEVEENGDK